MAKTIEMRYSKSMAENAKAELNNEQISKLQNIGVGLVLLFGSQASGFKHPGSDIDIGVIFLDNRLRNNDAVEVYGTLYEIFTKLFNSANLDIVYLEDTPFSLQFRAIYEGKVLYSKSGEFYANYLEKTSLLYMDFKPVEEEFQRAVLGVI